MAEKNRADLTSQNTGVFDTSGEGTIKGSNERPHIQDLIDSCYLKQNNELPTGTKAFTTAGTGTAYTVADGTINANSDLDGKPSFVIFNVDSTGAATIQFNDLAALTIKILTGKGSNLTSWGDIKKDKVYTFTKKTDVNEIYISESSRYNSLTFFSFNNFTFGANTDRYYDCIQEAVISEDYMESTPIAFVLNRDSIGMTTLIFKSPGNSDVFLDVKIKSVTSDLNIVGDQLKKDTLYLGFLRAYDSEVIITPAPSINDIEVSNTQTWSSNKINDAIQKGLVPVSASGSFGVFTATIPHITVLGDLSNYFYCIYFNSSFSNGDTLNINGLGAVTITTPASSYSSDVDYLYLFRYDGTVFRALTGINAAHIDTELVKGFYDGITEEARIELRESALVGFNFTSNTRDFHFSGDAPTNTPTNYIKLIAPNGTDQTGALQVISTHSGTTPEKIIFPSTDNNTYPDNKMVVNDGFEEEFPPYQHQTLTDAATVDFDLFKGFIGVLDSGSATARTINFRSTGSGGTGRVKKAQGYIYLDCDVTIDVSFELDGSDLRVMTIGGTHPLNIAGTASNFVIIPYRFNYDFGGSRLFIGDPEIYLGV